MSSTVVPCGLLPQVRTPRSIAAWRSSPSRVVQRCPGWITAWGGGAGSPANVYGPAPHHGHRGQWSAVLEPYGPGRLEEVTGAERSLSPRAVKETRERVHAQQ